MHTEVIQFFLNCTHTCSTGSNEQTVVATKATVGHMKAKLLEFLRSSHRKRWKRLGIAEGVHSPDRLDVSFIERLAVWAVTDTSVL